MSYEGQAHHPHVRGGPPNAERISLGEDHVPAGLQLVQAHWYIRHGERSRTYRLVHAGQRDICTVEANSYALKPFGRDSLVSPTSPTSFPSVQ